MSRREQWADTPADQDHIDAEILAAQDRRHDEADSVCGDVATDDPLGWVQLAQDARARLAHDLAACDRCGIRCETCDERMCATWGPEPAITCAAHPTCRDCEDGSNACRDCATARREAAVA